MPSHVSGLVHIRALARASSARGPRALSVTLLIPTLFYFLRGYRDASTITVDIVTATTSDILRPASCSTSGFSAVFEIQWHHLLRLRHVSAIPRRARACPAHLHYSTWGPLPNLARLRTRGRLIIILLPAAGFASLQFNILFIS